MLSSRVDECVHVRGWWGEGVQSTEYIAWPCGWCQSDNKCDHVEIFSHNQACGDQELLIARDDSMGMQCYICAAKMLALSPKCLPACWGLCFKILFIFMKPLRSNWEDFFWVLSLGDVWLVETCQRAFSAIALYNKPHRRKVFYKHPGHKGQWILYRSQQLPYFCLRVWDDLNALLA